MADPIALVLASHSEAHFEDLLGDWRWVCQCKASLGHLDVGAPIPPGVPAVAWRLAEHQASALSHAQTQNGDPK